MPVPEKTPIGPLDRPPCEACGGETWLARRSPHPELAPPTELWSFECRSCGRIRSRAVHPDGTPAD